MDDEKKDDLDQTPAEKLISEVIGTASRLCALRNVIKNNPEMLPDINSFLEMSYALGMVEGEVKRTEGLLSTTHAAWLRKTHPELVTEYDPKDWEKSQVAVRAYMAMFGPPDEATKATIDRTP